MAIESDLEACSSWPGVRAEDSNTHRHLCEFTRRDMEMAIKEHFFEVLDVLDNLFRHMFDGLNERFAHELVRLSRSSTRPSGKYLRPTSSRSCAAPRACACRAAGVEDVDPLGDLGTAQERELGRLVKEKYDTDFYILHKYPVARGEGATPCRIPPTRLQLV